jgi:hypothetical protein
MHGFVVHVGGEVVEKQDGGALLGEIVLQTQDLAAVAQGALGEQADLGQAVEHDPVRAHALEGLEDALRGLAEFEIRGIEQALLLVLVEEVLGRDELEQIDTDRSHPCDAAPMRSSSAVSDRVM